MEISVLLRILSSLLSLPLRFCNVHSVWLLLILAFYRSININNYSDSSSSSLLNWSWYIKEVHIHSPLQSYTIVILSKFDAQFDCKYLLFWPILSAEELYFVRRRFPLHIHLWVFGLWYFWHRSLSTQDIYQIFIHSHRNVKAQKFCLNSFYVLQNLILLMLPNT